MKGNHSQQWHPFKNFVDQFLRQHQTPSRSICSTFLIICWQHWGSEDEEDHNSMTSQLAIYMEEMELNQVMMQWAALISVVSRRL